MKLLYCWPREMAAMKPEADRLGAHLRNAKYPQPEDGVERIYCTPDCGDVRTMCDNLDIPCTVLGPDSADEEAQDAFGPDEAESAYADMGYQDLRRLASARELDVPGRPKKEELIEALEAADEA